MDVFYHFPSNDLEQHPISDIVVRVGRQLSFFVIVKLNAFEDGGTKMSRKQSFYLQIPFFFFVDENVKDRRDVDVHTARPKFTKITNAADHACAQTLM